jgi:hypothetical protein
VGLAYRRVAEQYSAVHVSDFGVVADDLSRFLNRSNAPNSDSSFPSYDTSDGHLSA